MSDYEAEIDSVFNNIRSLSHLKLIYLENIKRYHPDKNLEDERATEKTQYFFVLCISLLTAAQ